jgi:hypothetical protein
MSGGGEKIEIRVVPDSGLPPVRAGATSEAIAESGVESPPHDCWENPVPYESDGPLGHGWECGICGAFLQAG